MFSNNSDTSNLSLSVVGEGMDFDGEISTSGDLQVDGTVKGNIKAGDIVIGLAGKIEGNIECESLKINGTFSGEAETGNLTVCSEGRVDGKILYRDISVEHGGLITGEVKLNSSTNYLEHEKDDDQGPIALVEQ